MSKCYGCGKESATPLDDGWYSDGFCSKDCLMQAIDWFFEDPAEISAEEHTDRTIRRPIVKEQESSE